MHALIEVLDGGIGNSIQDRGRIGFRHMGITVSGWIDPMLARCANALVGNDADCACIEIRGAGPTLACGTGCCASVVAAWLNGLTERQVIVRLPLGELCIEYAADETVRMTGPAAYVFSGSWENY